MLYHGLIKSLQQPSELFYFIFYWLQLNFIDEKTGRGRVSNWPPGIWSWAGDTGASSEPSWHGLRSAAASWDVSGLEEARLQIPTPACGYPLAGPRDGCSACAFFQKTLRCTCHHCHFETNNHLLLLETVLETSNLIPNSNNSSKWLILPHFTDEKAEAFRG